MGYRTETENFFQRNKSVLVMGLIALTIAVSAEIVAGHAFADAMNDRRSGMATIFCCSAAMKGYIFCAMGSRLGTSMHIGTFRVSFEKGSVLRSNVEAAMVLTLDFSILIGVIGWIIAKILATGEEGVEVYVFISIVGGLLSGAIVVIFNILVAYIGHVMDWNVDDITVPIIAAVGDIVTIMMIRVAMLANEEVSHLYTGLTCLIFSIIMTYITIKIINGKIENEAKRIVKQSFPVLLACMIFGILVGAVIERGTEDITNKSILYVLLPAFLNEGNALSGMLTSRFGSMFHLGILKPTKIPSKKVCENFIVTCLLAAISLPYMGVIALVNVTCTISYASLIHIILLAGFVVVAAVIFLSYYIAVTAIKFKFDPDDCCIPVASSFIDVIATTSLIIIYYMIAHE
ncbi:MAG: magnesium transporter [archaeon]|nr:magnesium transporter [archaeon]